jgi:hypothetical protein
MVPKHLPWIVRDRSLAAEPDAKSAVYHKRSFLVLVLPPNNLSGTWYQHPRRGRPRVGRLLFKECWLVPTIFPSSDGGGGDDGAGDGGATMILRSRR